MYTKIYFTFTLLYSTLLYCTSLHFTSLHFTSLHFTSLHFTSLHFTSLHFTSLHFTSLHFTSLHFTSLHFTSLHFTSLHFTLLYFTLLYFTLLYFTLLYFTLLYFTLLYFTLLYFRSSFSQDRNMWFRFRLVGLLYLAGIVDGGYSEWSSWLQCSQTCGGGSRVRSRSCTNPSPSYSGKDCAELGPAFESEECNNDCCPGKSNFLYNSDCIAIKSSVMKIVYQCSLNHDPCKRLFQ